MQLVVVGHAASDVILRRGVPPSPPVLGGPVSYIGLAGAALGAQIDIVTVAPDPEPLLAPLEAEPRVRLHRVAAEPMTGFVLDYTQTTREVRLTHRAAAIAAVPTTLRQCSDVMLVPAFGELPPEAVGWFPGARLTVGLQGFMRSAAADGRIRAIDPPSMRGAYAVCFSEHDHPHADALADRLAREATMVVVTRGAAGATLTYGGEKRHVPSVPADEVDPTGAGDVFAAALALHLARGASPMDAASQASYAAARAVEGPGIGKLRS